MMLTVGNYETITYRVPIGRRVVRLLGPEQPDALADDPDVLDRFREDEYLPYWATPWQAALMLAEYVLANVAPTGRPVLEIGAGLGLCSIAMAFAGHQMIATDYDEDALRFIRASAELNGAPLRDIRNLDWRRPTGETFELIVGADVLYEKRYLEIIPALLTKSLSPGGVALLAEPNRSAGDQFAPAAERAGLNCETTQVSCAAITQANAVDYRTFQGRIFHVTRTGTGEGSPGT